MRRVWKMDGRLSNIDVVKRGFLTAQQGKIYGSVIAYIEKALIEEALKHSYGNKLKAARMLGINRNTLHAKIKKLNIKVRRFK